MAIAPTRRIVNCSATLTSWSDRVNIRSSHVERETRIAVDIGSTIVKVAHVSATDEVVRQEFHPRDFEAGIARQVESLIDGLEHRVDDDEVLICSSANGGLRVGIVCLSKLFSGAVLRNQVLLAGANPLFVQDFEEAAGDTRQLDLLLVGGGIDCVDAAPLEKRLAKLDLGRYHFGAALWAGNDALAPAFLQKCSKAHVTANPIATSLASRSTSVIETLRQAYLDNIVYKEGISELRASLASRVRATPEVVNHGFKRAVFNHSTFPVTGACILMDIGGATTDIHYTVEIVRVDSDDRPLAGTSVARYVFTDLGIVASRDSTVLAMRTHPRIYEFLTAVLGDDTENVYRGLREGEHQPSLELMSYACLFLALDRFSAGRGPGLPVADLRKLAQLVLTGGAAQTLDVTVVRRIVNLFLSEQKTHASIQIDKRYRFWIDGITWSDELL